MQFQKISILPPTEGIGISWGMGGSGRSKNMKKCMKLYWNFQRGGEVLEKIPSVREVWIFFGTTQCLNSSVKSKHRSFKGSLAFSDTDSSFLVYFV